MTYDCWVFTPLTKTSRTRSHLRSLKRRFLPFWHHISQLELAQVHPYLQSELAKISHPASHFWTVKMKNGAYGKTFHRKISDWVGPSLLSDIQIYFLQSLQGAPFMPVDKSLIQSQMFMNWWNEVKTPQKFQANIQKCSVRLRKLPTIHWKPETRAPCKQTTHMHEKTKTRIQRS